MLLELRVPYLAFYAVLCALLLGGNFFLAAKAWYPKARNGVTALASLGFIYFLLHRSPLDFAVMLGLSLAVYAVAVPDAQRGKIPTWGVKTAVLALALLFLANKLLKASTWGDAHPAFEILGLTYLIFKLVHFAVDGRAGMITERSLPTFINWVFFFPIYISGPLVRYQDFHRELNQVPERWEAANLLLIGTKRNILGLFKLIVLSKFVSPFAFFNLAPEYLANSSFLELVLYSHAGLIYLYLNFSGYCDLAIGISQWMGVRIPENFHWFFLARNFQDIWKRWNITVGDWLRTYIFFPLYKALLKRGDPKKHSNLFMAVSMFVTFFLMGIFNGMGVNYIIHGLLLGAAVVVVVQWGNFLKSRGWLQRYMKIKAVHAFSVLLTFHYFSFCVLFFDANTPEKLRLLMRMIGRYVP